MESWSCFFKTLIATTAFASIRVCRRYLACIRKECILERHQSYGVNEDGLGPNIPLAVVLASKIVRPESLMRCWLDRSLYTCTDLVSKHSYSTIVPVPQMV